MFLAQQVDECYGLALGPRPLCGLRNVSLSVCGPQQVSRTEDRRQAHIGSRRNALVRTFYMSNETAAAYSGCV